MAHAERTDFWLFGSPISHSMAPTLHNFIFDSCKQPTHRYRLKDTKAIDSPESEFVKLIRDPKFGGAAITMPLKVAAIAYVDELDTAGKAVGSINTAYLKFPSDSSLPPIVVGTNTDYLGVRNSLLWSIKNENPTATLPSTNTDPVFQPGTAYSYIIGGGGTTRAAVYALNTLGVSPIYLVNRDPAETQAVIDGLPSVDLIALTSVEQAKSEIAKQAKAGKRLSVGVGAIPAFAPVTDAEKMVYAVLQELFDSEDIGGEIKGRHHIEMPYSPLWTPIMQMGKDAGWVPISGIEAMIGQGLAQQYLWQETSDLGEAEEQARVFMTETLTAKAKAT